MDGGGGGETSDADKVTNLWNIVLRILFFSPFACAADYYSIFFCVALFFFHRFLPPEKPLCVAGDCERTRAQYLVRNGSLSSVVGFFSASWCHSMLVCVRCCCVCAVLSRAQTRRHLTQPTAAVGRRIRVWPGTKHTAREKLEVELEQE